MSDNRELAEKLLDAADMEEEMSRTKDDWLEEIHNENLANLEQLQSDNEDLKDEIKRLERQLQDIISKSNVSND